MAVCCFTGWDAFCLSRNGTYGDSNKLAMVCRRFTVDDSRLVDDGDGPDG